MADFGNFCLLFALCLSVFSLLAALLGAQKKQEQIIRSAERAAFAAAACIALALFTLIYLLLADDFSVSHVASTSNRDLPIFYKITAVWGAHDGSLLLWVFFTAVISSIVLYQNRRRCRDMMPYVLAVLMLNLLFFLTLNVFLSNPFTRLMEVFADGSVRPYIPHDGRGLNPLLQYWAMLIHPPLLYLGFIGFVVPFAFAIAALATRQIGDTWIRITRRWTLATWLLLGIGLILGAKWAYVVLGWGGYWAWDPIENSSLMPWLTATAFLHSVIVQERRGMLKMWNVLLIVFTYLLGVFGTFLTRSGIVNSVHAFADSNLGRFFIYYMAIILAGSLYLIARRRSYLKSEQQLDSILSRESVFLFNNLILVVSCFAILWGTMFPVFSRWIKGIEITVGASFFNSINIPIGLLLLFLTGVGPLFAWHRTSTESLKKSCFWPSIIAIIAAVGLFAAGMRSFYPLICLSICSFVLVTVFEDFFKGVRIRSSAKKETFPSALVNLVLKNQRRYGGYIIHFSIVMIFIGLTGSAFNLEESGRLHTNEKLKIGNYEIKLADYQKGDTANYEFGRITLHTYKNGKMVGTLTPERRVYKTGDRQSITTVALYSTPKEDLYVVFAGISGNSQYEILAHLNPLVFWIWFGSAIMVVGAIITLLPGRTRS